MKTIYLLRHSIPEQEIEIKNSEIPLSLESNQCIKELMRKMAKEFDKVYTSSYLRAVQTAQEISECPIIVDDLIERVIGENAVPDDFWVRQYLDYDYKLGNGESIRETKSRMKKRINAILHEINEDETIAIVSHATAICAYLSTFCSIEVVDSVNKIRKICYNDKVVLEGIIKTPSAFILQFTKDDELMGIEYQQ